MRETLTISALQTAKTYDFFADVEGTGENTGQRSVLSKQLNNFKNFIVSLIISLFISKLYNSVKKCEKLPLD